MPEPRSRTSSDVPDFDTYPAQSPEEVGAPEAAAVPERELPEWGDHRLNQQAERVGRAVGHTVVAARMARERVRVAKARVVTMQGRARESAASTVDALRHEAQTRVDELRHTAEIRLRSARAVAADKIEDLRESPASRIAGVRAAAAGRLEDLRERAAEAGERARRRAVRVADEEPLKVILVAGVAAFAAGVALRLWRSSHD
jgi:ElaB/YqjD/DUF883 family membrane-anchored ribosome-binding protein